MTTPAVSSAGTVRISTDEDKQYVAAHKRIAKYRADITLIVQKIKVYPPKPVPGSCARLQGGMGSKHLGGTACLWDSHNPTKPDGNPLAWCRWSHTHWNPMLEPTQPDIDLAVAGSKKGSLHLLLCNYASAVRYDSALH
jgi:hypothetical protein